MKVAVMQPYFFPYIGYWQLIAGVDKFVIFDDVNFINRGWINRNKILVKGEGRYINILLKGASQNKLINEIELFDLEDWRNKILQNIRTSYKKAPYFFQVFPVIEKAISTKENNLAKYLTVVIDEIVRYLEIDTEILISSQIEKDVLLKGQEKVLAICEQLEADIYINPIGGTELYSRELFLERGIELYFLQSEEIIYEQFGADFVPWLSIIDVMMFNSKENVKIMLKNYTLR